MSSSVLRLEVRCNRPLLRDLLHVAFVHDPEIVVAQPSMAEHAAGWGAGILATVALLDGDGLREMLSEIPSMRARGARILVLLASTGDYQLAKATAAGATGFVHTTEGLAALREAIIHTGRGSHYVSPGVQARRSHPAIMAVLSDREREVFELASQGITDADSATTLGLSPATIEGYRTSGLRKLGIRDWMHLVVLGVQVGAARIDDINVSSAARRSARRAGA